MLPSFPLLLLHVTGAIGFTIVVSMGVIAQPVRSLWERVFKILPKWAGMISCPMCFGVWGGAGWATILTLRSHEPKWICATHDVLAFAFTVSLVGFLVALVDHAVGGLGAIKNLPKYKPTLLRRRRW